MGIEPNGEYGNDCTHCWAAGKTPKHIYFSITGIKQGNWWSPGDPAPPNGIKKLTQSVGLPCLWDLSEPDANYGYNVNATQSRFVINFYNPYMSVFLKNEGKCKYFATNQYQNPTSKYYYGGTIQIWTL